MGNSPLWKRDNGFKKGCDVGKNDPIFANIHAVSLNIRKNIHISYHSYILPGKPKPRRLYENLYDGVGRSNVLCIMCIFHIKFSDIRDCLWGKNGMSPGFLPIPNGWIVLSCQPWFTWKKVLGDFTFFSIHKQTNKQTRWPSNDTRKNSSRQKIPSFKKNHTDNPTSEPRKRPFTFRYTAWLIGILIMVYYNPYTTG